MTQKAAPPGGERALNNPEQRMASQAPGSEMRASREIVAENSAWISPLREEMGRVIVGQKHLLDRLLIALLTNGHVLLEGVPGLAKTLALKSLASCIAVRFKRLQFTPDMLPADIVGTMIYNPQDGAFRTKHGPIFSNLILADEINRAPEQEGTYPLPEAQIDRFMMKVIVDYPTRTEERAILDAMATTEPMIVPRTVVSPSQILDARHVVNMLFVDDKVRDYIVDIVLATRPPIAAGLDLNGYVQTGASPRATIALTLAAKAYAFLKGRGYVTPQDVKSAGPDVLRHRIIVSYEAEAENVSSENVIEKILNTLPVP